MRNRATGYPVIAVIASRALPSDNQSQPNKETLLSLAERVRRLSPSHREPEAYHLEKWEIEKALRRMARGERHG